MMIESLATIVASIGVASVALVAVATKSIEFARWYIEREDRLADESQPLTTEVRRIRRETLLRQRKLHVDRSDWLVNKGFDSQARDHELIVERMDRELSRLEDA